MAYTPTTWNNGDIITAEKLNKLEQGVQNEQVGPAGAAAGFGTPTATVDANTGTPSVEVTTSGPDTAKVFNFAFKNLKGADGADGAPGAKGEPGEKGDPGETYILPAATTEVMGGVKMAAAVADAAAAPTQQEFNALLTSLRAAGIIAPSA